MIENISVFTRKGLVLWDYSTNKLVSSPLHPVDHLISSVFLEDKMSQTHCDYMKYRMKWVFSNEYNLFFVVVFDQSMTPSTKHFEMVLELSKTKFIESYGDYLEDVSCEILSKKIPTFSKFTDEFNTILSTVEEKMRVEKIEKKKGKKMRGFQPKNKKQKLEEIAKEKEKSEILSTIKKKKKKMRGFQQKNAKSKKSSKKTPKKPRNWNGEDGINKYSKELEEKLNKGHKNEENTKRWEEKFGVNEASDIKLEVPDDENGDIVEEDIDDDEDQEKTGKKRGGIWGFISSLAGSKTLEKEQIEKVMEKFKLHLIGKNVAQTVAQQICDSVTQSLVGKKVGKFSTLYRTVKAAISEAITRILTCKRQINIKREVLEAKEAGEPYSMVFCGINGVGKSTSLAKIAFWLKNEGFSVMIAACDTFRSGAVEQLKVHATCLKVPLFQQGYGKEPHLIAKEAVEYAGQNEIDVVLIDTAGRMQDNEQLMKALAKLISYNNPNLTLFVGEALVGNQGVVQLTEFDGALRKHSSKGEENRVDGIILTKFDTIDDKVGAAVSMVYISGHPIVFVGTGQKYPHLKELSPANVVYFLEK